MFKTCKFQPYEVIAQLHQNTAFGRSGSNCTVEEVTAKLSNDITCTPYIPSPSQYWTQFEITGDETSCAVVSTNLSTAITSGKHKLNKDCFFISSKHLLDYTNFPFLHRFSFSSRCLYYKHFEYYCEVFFFL